MYICVHVFKSQKRALYSPATGVTDGCDLPRGCGLNTSPPEV